VTAGDITSDETRRRVVDRTIGAYGAIDILINNARRWDYPLLECTMDQARLSWS